MNFIAIPEVRERFYKTFHYSGLELSPKLICPPITKLLEIDNKRVITKGWASDHAIELIKNYL